MKKRLLWIIELILWLLVLFSVSGAIIYAKYNYKRQFNTYQMFLPDVDGLINGSPVRLMGIQIGYVNQLDIVGEDVYVKFIVTEPDIRIPSGSTATVEFSGLGGSKSLEIYPPKQDTILSDRLLISQPPKRIHDSLGLLNDMIDKIVGIAYNVSDFMHQVGMIKLENGNGSNGEITPVTPGKFLDNSNNWLDGATKNCDEFKKKLNHKEKKSGNANGESENESE